MQLHRLIYTVSPGGSERKLIDQLGLHAGPISESIRHGVAQVDYAFDSESLRLVWLLDEAPLAAEHAIRMRLRERLRWPEYDANPFTIVMALENTDAPPQDCWELTIEHQTFWVMNDCDRLDLPLVIWQRHQDLALEGPRQSSVGLKSVSKLIVTITGAASSNLTQLEVQGVIELWQGPSAHVFLEIDGGLREQQVDLAPLLPIGFRV